MEPKIIEVVTTKVIAPAWGVNMDRPLIKEEIQAVYDECSSGRAIPDWIRDADGNIVGWNRISIDAWCE